MHAPATCFCCFTKCCCPLSVPVTKCWKLATSLIVKIKDPLYGRIFLLYIVTFIFILPLTCRNLPNSMFNVHGNENVTNARQKSMREENSKRVQNAETFLHQLDALKASNLLQNYASGSDIHVQLSVITVSRNRHKVDSYEPRYLSQIIWRLFSVLQSHTGPRPAVHLSICDVDPDPGSYAEAMALEILVPVIHRYKDSSPPSKIHALEKEKQDYMWCLMSALKRDADYVLLVEDDALPHPDLLSVLQHTIMHHLRTTFPRGEPGPESQNTAFVKLYHPPHLVSYIALEPERLPELFAFSMLFGTLLTLAYWGAGIVLSTPDPKVTHTWLLLIRYSTLVAIALGRANTQEFRRLLSPALYSYTPAPSCCTPAVIFPANTAPAIISFLNRTTCHKNYGKDSALETFISETHQKAYLVQPNLFDHIGMYSSLRKKLVDPFVIR